jgi:hypothetical protein
MRFGCSWFHHCSLILQAQKCVKGSVPATPDINSCQPGTSRNTLTAGSHARRRYFPTSAPTVVSTSLRVRVMRQAWGCLPGHRRTQQVFPHFPVAAAGASAFNGPAVGTVCSRPNRASRVRLLRRASYRAASIADTDAGATCGAGSKGPEKTSWSRRRRIRPSRSAHGQILIFLNLNSSSAASATSAPASS